MYTSLSFRTICIVIFITLLWHFFIMDPLLIIHGIEKNNQQHTTKHILKDRISWVNAEQNIPSTPITFEELDDEDNKQSTMLEQTMTQGTTLHTTPDLSIEHTLEATPMIPEHLSPESVNHDIPNMMVSHARRPPSIIKKERLKTYQSNSNSSSKKSSQRTNPSQSNHEQPTILTPYKHLNNGPMSTTQLITMRYYEKILACIVNAFNIKKHTYSSFVQSQVLSIQIIVNRDGSLDNVNIIQASGNTIVDNNSITLMQYASKSFPPIPPYLDRDFIPLIINYVDMRDLSSMQNWHLTN